MKSKYTASPGEQGWTFIEATMGVILVSIIVLGLAVTMLAMRDTVDRSLAVRVMDQYGNDIMAHFQKVFETANKFVPIPSQSSGTMDHFELVYIDPFSGVQVRHRYQPSKTQGIKMDSRCLDPQFPPQTYRRNNGVAVLDENESFTVTRFTAVEAPREGNSVAFSHGTIRVTMTIRYTRKSVDPGEGDYTRDMTYSTLCFMKNQYVESTTNPPSPSTP
jgi:hypothetical protein